MLLEMAVLASSLALSPVTPEILAARELRRGTLQLIEDIAPYRHLGIEPPPLRLLINRVHPVSSNARLIQQALRQVFQAHAGIQVLNTDVPAIEAYPRAATRGLPVHRVEYRQPVGRTAPAALETMRALIEFALGEGWHLKRTRGGHLMFTKPGYAAIYTSSTASDHRASRNARAQLRRADRQVLTASRESSDG